jgi:glycosyltransferase involved in cell wall biosynthesis
MKFSIVTISFNQAEFLERTIQSVISQKGVEIDYIMVDPGSTDGSRDIIERYRQHFSHLVYERDKGPADGLNKGFALARGDIYGYLNSDDTFEPEAFAKVADYFAKHPQVDVGCGHAFVTNRYDHKLRRVWSEPFLPTFVAYGQAVQIQPSTFIRKAAFERSGGFNIENRCTWDGELLADLYLTGARFTTLPYFLSTYRLHATSITNSGALESQMMINALQSFEKLMGRPFSQKDKLIGQALRLVKHVSNPIALIERLRRGPIFRRGEA